VSRLVLRRLGDLPTGARFVRDGVAFDVTSAGEEYVTAECRTPTCLLSGGRDWDLEVEEVVETSEEAALRLDEEIAKQNRWDATFPGPRVAGVAVGRPTWPSVVAARKRYEADQLGSDPSLRAGLGPVRKLREEVRGELDPLVAVRARGGRRDVPARLRVVHLRGGSEMSDEPCIVCGFVSAGHTCCPPTEFGIFSDEGLIEGDFWSKKAATAASLHDRFKGAEAFVAEICDDHPDQPKDDCENCNSEDEEEEGKV